MDLLLQSDYINHKVEAAGINGKSKFKNMINKRWD